MFDEKKLEFEVEGVKCSFSTGKFAIKSQTAVMAQMGETIVLATVNVTPQNGDSDYFPLQVEYIEKMYAAGKISGSRFVKRDRFPSDDATLKARIIDRSIRSRFPEDYRDEVQVIVKVMSFDSDNDPLIVGINAVSAALMLSACPFDAPVAGVRVGYKDEKYFALNKHVDRDDIEESKLDLLIAGDENGLLTNIDSNAYELEEDVYVEAMSYGIELMKSWTKVQKEFVALHGEIEKSEYVPYAIPEDLLHDVKEKYSAEIAGNIRLKEWREARSKTMEKMIEEFSSQFSKKMIDEAYEYVAKLELRALILSEGVRADGRTLDEIRPLEYEVGLLPRVHGSGMFTRGRTQVLTTTTLASIRNQMLIDDMTGEDMRRYMHYYVEGPYSFGEAGRVKYIPGRREIGHGALAEKALYPVLPSEEEFPYTILLMSEILSEEGSSSMGSTCGSTLALMDAGVPIKKPVAGIAIGVIMNEETGDFKLVTDIKDMEDFYGYMDFKVAGTRDGVTAIQMDTKAFGLPLEVFKQAFVNAKKARLQILDGMYEVISKPREVLSEHAPRVEVLKIPVSKIGDLIGPGGKNIRKIVEDTGAELNVEDDGTVQIFATTDESLEAARELVAAYSFEPEIGKVYAGTVAKIVEFGAFIRLAPGVEGLLHVSEIADSFVKDVHDFIKEDETVEVKVLDIDPSGKMKLSMKAVKEKE
jgi:polyribonucleotide nucleotidyltransferase